MSSPALTSQVTSGAESAACAEETVDVEVSVPGSQEAEVRTSRRQILSRDYRLERPGPGPGRIR